MASLGLFPLPLVLFPGALVPLHIFEPRYRTLLTDAVEGDHRFGLLPPGPDGGLPKAGAVGCVARVRAVQPLPDGRSNIVVSGEDRFRLDRLLASSKPYLVGETSPLEDLPDVQVPSEADLESLRLLAERYASALAALTDVERDAEFSDEASRLTFQVASLLEWDFPVKQHFLTLRSATERVTRLLHALPRLLADLETRVVVHRRASRNGSGARHS
jgi:Lon protease-like protein